MPTPLPQVPLYENISVWVAAVTLFGVGMTLWAAARRSKSELTAAESRSKAELAAAETRLQSELTHRAAQAAIEREQTRAQSALDRQHAESEAHRERITSARRAVYLEATQALVEAQMFLGNLANIDLAKLDYNAGFERLLSSVARVTVIGEQATVEKARLLSNALNKIFFKAVAQLLPMGGLRAAEVVHNEQYATTQAEIRRILAAMVNHNETKKGDAEGFAAIVRSFESQQTLAKQFASAPAASAA